jgi:preprotein translocase subunit SecD
MLNRFPFWKNLLVLFIIVLGFIYALPNFYGEDNAVQISGNKTDIHITTDQIQQVKKLLVANHLDFKSVEKITNGLLIRFKDTDSQFTARSLLKSVFDDQYTIAINLAPATPRWLQFLNANPMKLGLDLREAFIFCLKLILTE